MQLTTQLPRPTRATLFALRWPAPGPGGSPLAWPALVAPAGALRLVRWALAGGGSLVLQLAIQALLIQTLALPAKLGIVVAYELALVAHFFVNERWVFEQHRLPSRPSGADQQRHHGAGGRGRWRRLGKFHASALTAEAVTLAVAFLLLAGPVAALLGPALAPFVATIAGTLAATAVTFSASFFWIWRPQRVC